ncbi:MAG: Maf family protein [bacterium]|nr:Maf family protein [bacterium]
MFKLILASSSPQRAKLLKQAGFDFEVIFPGIEEEPSGVTKYLSPSEYVMAQAIAKAAEVASRVKEGIILGADTIVTCQGEIIGKPFSSAEASRMLHQLQGTTHEVITGLALFEAKSRHRLTDYVVTEVTMKSLTEEQITDYVSTGEPLGKAGGLDVAGRGAVFIEKVTGCFYNLLGLPVARLADMLAKAKRLSRNRGDRNQVS